MQNQRTQNRPRSGAAGARYSRIIRLRRRGIIHLLPIVVLLLFLVFILVSFFAVSEKRRAVMDEELQRATQAERTARQASHDTRIKISPPSDADPPAVKPTSESTAKSSAEAAAEAPADGSRPAWLGKPPHLETRDGIEVYLATASAGPYQTDDECDQVMDGEINKAVAIYSARIHPSDLGTQSGDTQQPVTLDSEFVQTHLIQGRWRETVDASFGPMRQETVLLAFDPRARAQIEHGWRETVVAGRLKQAGIAASAVLVALGCAFSLLKWGPGARRVSAGSQRPAA
jgi:hypothetical protein